MERVHGLLTQMLLHLNCYSSKNKIVLSFMNHGKKIQVNGNCIDKIVEG